MELVRRTYFVFALFTILGFAGLPAAAQSGRKFYIDYASGSNSNPGTQAAPWKTHPYMQTGSGCTGTGNAPAYSHQIGDQFIFKGGVTWPVACFSFNITQGGNSTVQDYYGVDKSWYNGGSFTRPLFDMGNSEPNGNTVIQAGPLTGGTYVTLDNFEINGQSIDLSEAASQASYGSGCGILLNTYSHGANENMKSGDGTTVSNVFIHDWVGNAGQSVTSYSLSEGCFGGIQGAATLTGTTISAQNSKINGSPFAWGGGCHYCATISNSHFTYGWFGDVYWSSAGTHISHDNEFDNFVQNVPSTGNPDVHTHVIYDNQSVVLGSYAYIYNNSLHDNSSGLLTFIGYNSAVYNNVIWNNTNGFILNAFGGSGDSSGNVGHWYNNTMDTAGGGSTTCLIERQAIGSQGGSISGTFNYKNNICIGAGQGGGWSGGTQNIASNLVMSASEQATYGFTSGNKYAPTSSDPNVAGKGVNLVSSLQSLLSSSSSNLAALQYDAAGAPWFGGSYNQRSSTWDLGAFAISGQLSTRPSAPSNLSAIVQ